MLGKRDSNSVPQLNEETQYTPKLDQRLVAVILILCAPMIAAALVSAIENILKAGPDSALGKTLIINLVVFYVAPAIFFFIAGAFERDRGIEHDPPRLAAAIIVASALFYGAKLLFYWWVDIAFTHRLLMPLVTLIGLWLVIWLAFATLRNFKMSN